MSSRETLRRDNCAAIFLASVGSHLEPSTLLGQREYAARRDVTLRYNHGSMLRRSFPTPISVQAVISRLPPTPGACAATGLAEDWLSGAGTGADCAPTALISAALMLGIPGIAETCMRFFSEKAILAPFTTLVPGP